METGEEIVQEKMRVLIAVSCQFDESPNPHFSSFHKVYLKFSFDAVDVKVDYENQMIYTANSKPLTKNPVRLFDMGNALSDKFSFSDLEETLVGCLKTGHLENHFYKKLLLEYGGNSPDNPDFQSA